MWQFRNALLYHSGGSERIESDVSVLGIGGPERIESDILVIGIWPAARANCGSFETLCSTIVAALGESNLIFQFFLELAALSESNLIL